MCLFNQLLLQAAEWKLQAQTLRDQAAVMQAQVNTRRLTPAANASTHTDTREETANVLAAEFRLDEINDDSLKTSAHLIERQRPLITKKLKLVAFSLLLS